MGCNSTLPHAGQPCSATPRPARTNPRVTRGWGNFSQVAQSFCSAGEAGGVTCIETLRELMPPLFCLTTPTPSSSVQKRPRCVLSTLVIAVTHFKMWAHQIRWRTSGSEGLQRNLLLFMQTSRSSEGYNSFLL